MTDYSISIDKQFEFSVIVCAYNGSKVIEPCLNKLINQNFEKNEYEIIIINDGSQDNTSDIVKSFINKNRYNGLKISFYNIPHGGLATARNHGIVYSNGKYIAYIDQDAIPESNWLQELLNFFHQDDKLGIVGGKVKILNDKSWFAAFSHWFQYYAEDLNGNEIIPIIGCNMAFKKQVFLDVGGFFENFHSCGDETSFIKIKGSKYFKTGSTSKAVVYHERPWSIVQWLKERFRNGREYALERIIGNYMEQSKSYRFYSYLLYRFFSLGFLPLLLLCLIYNDAKLEFIFIINTAFLLYRCFIRDNALMRLKVFKREYGYLKSIYLTPLYMILVIIGKFFDDFGFLIGIKLYISINVLNKKFKVKKKYSY